MSDLHNQSNVKLKHSGIGIASFVISIIVGVLIVILVMFAAVMEATTPGGIDDESAEAVIVGLLIITLILADLVAMGLGIAGLVQKNRKKVFATLGTIFSSVAVVGTVALIFVGSML